jgi:peptidoglycan/xylan/chitin deacetylase (PgdA/CDA1 family)
MAMKILNLFWHNIQPDSIGPEKQDRSSSTASLFREQIKFITSIYTPIPISDFIEITNNPNLKPSFLKPPVILGFDDGFRNVITEALPILNEFKVPAVFFVIGAILKDPEFVPWFIELKHLLRRTERSTIDYSGLSINLSSQQDRVKLLHLFEASFRAGRSEVDRQRLLLELAEGLAVGRPVASDLDEDLCLVTKADLAAIDSSSLLTIASHAMTHRHLDCLAYDDQVAELEESDSLLRLYSPSYYPVVSYPSGCFNADTIAIAKKIYKAGFAAFLNSSYRNGYEYPRICINRVSAKELAYILSPIRLNCLLPLKRFLHTTGIRKI